MTLFNASKSDVRNPRLEQLDSLQLHGVTTAERDAKDIQLEGDMVYNSETQNINLRTSSGWVELLEGDPSSIVEHAVLYGGANGEIVGDVNNFSYMESTNTFMVNSPASSAVGVNNFIAGVGNNIVNTGGAPSTDNNYMLGFNLTMTDTVQSALMGNNSAIDGTVNPIQNAWGFGRNFTIRHSDNVMFNLSNFTFETVSPGIFTVATNNGALFNDRSVSAVGSFDKGTFSYAFNGSTWLNGGYRVGINTISSPNYTAVDNDYVISVVTTVNPVTITIPTDFANEPGRMINIHDVDGNAGTNNITVNTLGIPIDGSPNFTINTNRQSVTFMAAAGGRYITISRS